MTLLRSDAGASRRARSKGLRVLLGVASMLLLDGCRTWDGDGYGHRPYYFHQHRRQPPHHPPPPAPLIVPKFHAPTLPPPLPVQPSYRPPPPSGHHGHHQRSGEPWRRPGQDHGTGHGGQRHERKWRDGDKGNDHRKRR